MPSWKTHLIFGCLLLLLWFNILYFFMQPLLTFKNISIFSVLTIFISIFPDVDLKKSKSRALVSFLIASIFLVVYIFTFPQTWYYGIAFAIIVYLLFLLLPTKHRGITHYFLFSLIFTVLLSLSFYLVFNLTQTEALFLSGIVLTTYCLHLFLDKI